MEKRATILADQIFSEFLKDDEKFIIHVNNLDRNMERFERSEEFKKEGKLFIEKVFKRIEIEKPLLAKKIFEFLFLLGKFKTVNLIAHSINLKKWKDVSPLVKSSLIHLIENVKKNKKAKTTILIDRIYQGLISAIDEHIFEETLTTYELYGSVLNISDFLLIHYFNLPFQEPLMPSHLFFLEELSIRFGQYLSKFAGFVVARKYTSRLINDYYNFDKTIISQTKYKHIIQTIRLFYETNKELITRPRTPPRRETRRNRMTTHSLPSSIHDKTQKTWARMATTSGISPLTLSLEKCDLCDRKKIDKDSIWKGNSRKFSRLCGDCKHNFLYAPPTP